jgi:hypothetical protein
LTDNYQRYSSRDCVSNYSNSSLVNGEQPL